MARASLRISKEFATSTEPRRPGKGPKSVSEALLSLFDRTSPKLVRLKKTHIFRYLMILAALLSSRRLSRLSRRNGHQPGVGAGARGGANQKILLGSGSGTNPVSRRPQLPQISIANVRRSQNGGAWGLERAVSLTWDSLQSKAIGFNEAAAEYSKTLLVLAAYRRSRA
jgi:hypothetical protein